MRVVCFVESLKKILKMWGCCCCGCCCCDVPDVQVKSLEVCHYYMVGGMLSVFGVDTTPSSNGTHASDGDDDVAGVAVECRATKDDHVVVDLRYGVVTGYSPYISFVRTPTPPGGATSAQAAGQRCSSQAVLKVVVTDPNKGMTLVVSPPFSPSLSLSIP